MNYTISISYIDGSSRLIQPTDKFEPHVKTRGKIQLFENAKAIVLDISKDERGKRKIIELATIHNTEKDRTVILYKYTPSPVITTKIKTVKQKELVLTN
jgi:hypothetical protein